MKHGAPAYWPTRIMLAVGIVATLAVLAVSLVLGANQPFIDARPLILGLDPSVVPAAAGVGLAVFGLVWMLRIFRGARDEPPAWRYRRR